MKLLFLANRPGTQLHSEIVSQTIDGIDFMSHAMSQQF